MLTRDHPGLTLSPFFRPNSSALRFVTVISTVTGPTSKSVISPLSLADLDAELQELAVEYAAHPRAD
jgi:hypothetical protein